MDNQQNNQGYNKNLGFFSVWGQILAAYITEQESTGTYTLHFKEVPFV